MALLIRAYRRLEPAHTQSVDLGGEKGGQFELLGAQYIIRLEGIEVCTPDGIQPENGCPK